MRRKETQKDRVRRWLEAHGSIKTGDALHVMKPEIRQLHQRIAELREEGLQIDADWLYVDGRKTKEYVYTLATGPKPVPVQMQAPDGRVIPVKRERVEEALARGLVLV